MPVVKKETKEKNTTKTASKKKVTKAVVKQVKDETNLVVESKKDKKKVTQKVETKKNMKNSNKNIKKVGFFKKIGTFFREVKKEMSHVKWPGKKEMVKYSSATVLFILFFAAFFYIIELVFAALRTLV